MYESARRTHFISTRHRGLSYRERKEGRTYFGYVGGKRVRLDSVTEREAVAEYGELRGKIRKGEKLPPASVKLGEVAQLWLEGIVAERPKRSSRETTMPPVSPRSQRSIAS